MTINARTVNRLLWPAPGAQTPLKFRTRSEAICGSSESASARPFFFFPFLFSADIYARISLTPGGDAWAAAEGHVLADEELFLLLRPPLRSLVSPESFFFSFFFFLLTLAVGLAN